MWSVTAHLQAVMQEPYRLSCTQTCDTHKESEGVIYIPFGPIPRPYSGDTVPILRLYLRDTCVILRWGIARLRRCQPVEAPWWYADPAVRDDCQSSPLVRLKRAIWRRHLLQQSNTPDSRQLFRSLAYLYLSQSRCVIFPCRLLLRWSWIGVLCDVSTVLAIPDSFVVFRTVWATLFSILFQARALLHIAVDVCVYFVQVVAFLRMEAETSTMDRQWLQFVTH